MKTFFSLFAFLVFWINGTVCYATFHADPMLISTNTTITEDLEFAHTAFVIKGSNITLDLGGHTVKFNAANNVAAPNREFETWSGNIPTGWTVVSGTTSSAEAIYFGDKDLIVSSGGGVLRSSTITLPAGKTFMPFAFVKSNSANSATLRIKKASDLSILTEKTLTGSHISRGYASTGDPTSDAYYKPSVTTDVILELTLTGTGGDFTIGMVDIKPAMDYGVTASNWRSPVYFPDLIDSMFGAVSNIIIKNGTIEQVNEGVYNSAIRMGSGTWTIQDVNMIMRGINTNGIYAPYALSNPTTITGCNISSTSMSVFNRMYGTGGIKIAPGPTGGDIIANNVIDGVPQYGIFFYGDCGTTERAKSYITGNTIRQRELVTEGYAIGISGVRNLDITGNTITPYQGRGILIDAVIGTVKGSIDTTIANNQITNINEVRNFEYDENGLEAVGIRLRNWGATGSQHKNLQIYGNTITGFTDASRVHAVYGINSTISAAFDSVDIHDNSIVVTATGTGRRATAIALQNTKLDKTNSFLVHNNTLKSNNEFLRFGGNDGENAWGISFYNNTLSVPDGFTRTGSPFIAGYWTGLVNRASISGNNFSEAGLDMNDLANWSVDGSSGAKQFYLGGNMMTVQVIDQRTDKTAALDLNIKTTDESNNELMNNTVATGHTLTYFIPAARVDGTTSLTKTNYTGETFTITAAKTGYASQTLEVTSGGAVQLFIKDTYIEFTGLQSKPRITLIQIKTI